jgi:ATP-dependent Clp protease adaptor protein ClpS
MKQNVEKKLSRSQRVTEGKGAESRFLTLHNDDVNTFDYVIDSLIAVCEHDAIQAEQCAYITHHKGKCDVKKGTYNVLDVMRQTLLDRGLQVTID